MQRMKVSALVIIKENICSLSKAVTTFVGNKLNHFGAVCCWFLEQRSRKSCTMQGNISHGFNGDHKTVEEIGRLLIEVFNR